MPQSGQQCRRGALRVTPPGETGRAHLVAEVDVLGHGQAVDQVQLLVDGGDPAAHGGDRVGQAYFLTQPGDRSFVRLVSAGQYLDQRRLSGAVLAEEAMHLGGQDLEVDAVEGADAGKLLHDAVHLEQGHCHLVPPRTSGTAARTPDVGSARTASTATWAPPRTAAVKPNVDNTTEHPPRPGATTRLSSSLSIASRRKSPRTAKYPPSTSTRGLKMFTNIAAPNPRLVAIASSPRSVRPSPSSARLRISASRASRSTDGSATGSPGSATARSNAESPATVSQQPRRPHAHRSPSAAIAMWPTSPAKPFAPRSSRPSAITPAPTPVSPVRHTRSDAPAEAPITYSASAHKLA